MGRVALLIGHREYDENKATRLTVMLLVAVFAWAVGLASLLINAIMLIGYTGNPIIEIMGMLTGFALVVGFSTRIWEIVNVETQG